MSSTYVNVVSRILLDWYRRVLYHHDYFFTSVILMTVHTVLCIMPVVFVPSVICEDTSNQVRQNSEQFNRWLLLGLFAAIPLLLDVTFDYFKSSSATLERNQWRSRIILLLALTIPNIVIACARNKRSSLSLYDQCLVESAMIPSQTMILLGSVFCTMYQHHIYVANDDNDKKSKFSIEKRSIAALFHITISRALVFLFFLSGERNVYKIWITIVNALVISHIFILFTRYMWILLGERHNGEFTTAHALSDFLYCFATWLFLILGMISIVVLQITGVIRRSPDLAAVSLTIYRIIYLVFFNLFITVIPGRVYMLSARIEHQKLQTRLNLIRYVSHEMRSPLNTAFLGLEYVTTELSRMHAEWNNMRANQSFSAARPGLGFSTDDYQSTKKVPMKHGTAGHSSSPNSVRALDRGASEVSVMTAAGFGSSANLQSNAGSSKTGVSDVLDTVKQINASCNIALFTLNDLLTFDKLDEKKLEVELQPVNAWHFALETAKPFKINAKDSGVDFTISCGSFESHWYRDYQLRADEFKLSQVLRNLISNALKFTPSRGKVHMQVDMIPNYPTSGILHQGSTFGKLMRISVKDTGPGISKQNLHKLFGQYVQFNPSKLQKGGGSGLGLWISKSIVEMHEGTVRATSEGEGFGCTFIMELPLFHKSGQNVLEMGGTYAVETIPEGPDELDLVSVEGGVSSAPNRDIEAGTAPSGTASGNSPAAVNNNKRYAVPQAPAQRSFFANIFGGTRVSFTGARQFLNQKVRFTMVHQPASTPSEKDTANQASEREHYCINSDFDDIEHGEGSHSHDSYDESVQAYSSKKASLDSAAAGADAANSGGPSNNMRVVKIAGRVLSKASIVPIADDFEPSRGNSFATLPLCGAGSDGAVGSKPFKEGELVDLEEPTPLESPMLQSKTSSSLSPHTPKSWASKLRFLAVDDTALNRKMMARLLISAGHLVDEACDGLECLAAMNLTANSTAKENSSSSSCSTNVNTKYDVVLMDENMPNLSGPEAAEKLRQAGYKGLIIGVTGDCYQDQMDHFVHMGANAVLAKPLKLDHLRAKLEELWKF